MVLRLMGYMLPLQEGMEDLGFNLVDEGLGITRQRRVVKCASPWRSYL